MKTTRLLIGVTICSMKRKEKYRPAGTVVKITCPVKLQGALNQRRFSPVCDQFPGGLVEMKPGVTCPQFPSKIQSITEQINLFISCDSSGTDRPGNKPGYTLAIKPLL